MCNVRCHFHFRDNTGQHENGAMEKEVKLPENKNEHPKKKTKDSNTLWHLREQFSISLGGRGNGSMKCSVSACCSWTHDHLAAHFLRSGSHREDKLFRRIWFRRFWYYSDEKRWKCLCCGMFHWFSFGTKKVIVRRFVNWNACDRVKRRILSSSFICI